MLRSDNSDLALVLDELESLTHDLKKYHQNQLKNHLLRKSHSAHVGQVMPLPPQPVPPLRTGSQQSLYDNCSLYDNNIEKPVCPAEAAPLKNLSNQQLVEVESQMSPVMKRYRLEEEPQQQQPQPLRVSCLTSTSTSDGYRSSESSDFYQNQNNNSAVVYLSPCYVAPRQSVDSSDTATRRSRNVSFSDHIQEQTFEKLHEEVDSKREDTSPVVSSLLSKQVSKEKPNRILLVLPSNGDCDVRVEQRVKIMPLIRHNPSDDPQLRRSIVQAYHSDMSEQIDEGRPLSYKIIPECEEPRFIEEFHKVDRYGYIHDMKLPENYTAEEARLVKKQKEREHKWKKMLAKPNQLEKMSREKLSQRVYKGIPDAFRATAWSRLLGVDTAKQQHPGVFEACLDYGLANSKHIRQMDIDINRTFRDHVMFRERYGVKQRQLFHVLVAFSVYNAEVGYCQGMSSLAAFLLMYFESELDCFWALVILFTGLQINNPKQHQQKLISRYRMHGFYIDGFPKFQRFREHHQLLLKRYLPRLNKHFEKLQFKCEIYLLKWLLDVFIGAIPVSLLLRVWDIFMLEGERIMPAFAFCIVKMHEKRLLKLKQMEDVLGYFHALAASFGSSSDDVVIGCLQTTIDDLIRDKMLLPFVPQHTPQQLNAPLTELPRYRLGLVPPEIEQLQQHTPVHHAHQPMSATRQLQENEEALRASMRIQQQYSPGQSSSTQENQQPHQQAETPIIVMEDVIIVQKQHQQLPPQVPPPFEMREEIKVKEPENIVHQRIESPSPPPVVMTKSIQLKENIVVTFDDSPHKNQHQSSPTKKPQPQVLAESYQEKTVVIRSTEPEKKQQQQVVVPPSPPPPVPVVVTQQQVVYSNSPKHVEPPKPESPGPQRLSSLGHVQLPASPPSAAPATAVFQTSYTYSTPSPPPTNISLTSSTSNQQTSAATTRSPATYSFQPLKSVSETLSEASTPAVDLLHQQSPSTTYVTSPATSSSCHQASPSPLHNQQQQQYSLAFAQAKMERDLREAEQRRLRHQQARAEFFRAMLASGGSAGNYSSSPGGTLYTTGYSLDQADPPQQQPRPTSTQSYSLGASTSSPQYQPHLHSVSLTHSPANVGTNGNLSSEAQQRLEPQQHEKKYVTTMVIDQATQSYSESPNQKPSSSPTRVEIPVTMTQSTHSNASTGSQKDNNAGDQQPARRSSRSGSTGSSRRHSHHSASKTQTPTTPNQPSQPSFIDQQQQQPSDEPECIEELTLEVTTVKVPVSQSHHSMKSQQSQRSSLHEQVLAAAGHQFDEGDYDNIATTTSQSHHSLKGFADRNDELVGEFEPEYDTVAFGSATQQQTNRVHSYYEQEPVELHLEHSYEQEPHVRRMSSSYHQQQQSMDEDVVMPRSQSNGHRLSTSGSHHSSPMREQVPSSRGSMSKSSSRGSAHQYQQQQQMTMSSSIHSDV